MQRISNKSWDKEIEYVEKQVLVPVTHMVDRIVEVPVEKIIHVEVEKMQDLSHIEQKFDHHESIFQSLHSWNGRIANEMEMQRRALVGMKQQRDVDRKRRLQMIHRIKKHKDALNSVTLKLKIAIACSVVLSILALIRR